MAAILTGSELFNEFKYRPVRVKSTKFGREASFYEYINMQK
jgi:hypothetical protein